MAKPYIEEIEKFYCQRGSLHHSHITYLRAKLTAKGITPPEGDAALLAEAKRLGVQ